MVVSWNKLNPVFAAFGRRSGPAATVVSLAAVSLSPDCVVGRLVVAGAKVNKRYLM